MSTFTQRLAADVPGRMESHPMHRALTLRCTLRQLDPEGLRTAMCDAVQDGEKRFMARTDEETFKLHLQFVRAHGLPRGQFTTFSNGVVTRHAARDEDRG